MKTLRHPNVLVYLDGIEVRKSSSIENLRSLIDRFCSQSDKAVYVVTEKAVPLETYLNDLKSSSDNQTLKSEHLLEIAWGLQQLSVRRISRRHSSIDFALFI